MKVELLAPGGSYDSVLAALNAGADAVYTGGELFGARAGADNLTKEQLIDVIHYAHLHNKKIYLTVNTLLKNKEITNQLFDYLNPLYREGLDAVIVQDFGVIKYVHNCFPDLPIHASTQMTIFGSRTVEELKKYGVTRIVTPRELSVKEIKNIYEQTNMEIESFVHGALCYCYSGQCMMSSFIGGRSGNRGRCAQPCRMEYDLLYKNNIINRKDEKYLLSPKDICTINILPQIIESGVFSLKIEGRMKKTEYIAGVVEIYRKYLDLYLKSPQNYEVSYNDYEKLLSLFNRNGFHESYYNQHNGRNMISLKKIDFRTENVEYTDYLKSRYCGKSLKYPLDIIVECVKDKPLLLKSNINLKKENRIKEIIVEGAIPEPAKSKPIDEFTLKKQISKLGNTDFMIRSVEIHMDNELFLPVSEIKELRRSFIEMIEQEIQTQFKRSNSRVVSLSFSMPKKIKEEKMDINALVWNVKQFQTVLHSDVIDDIYLESSQFSSEELMNCIHMGKTKNKHIYLALPFVFRMEDEKKFSKIFHKILPDVYGVLIRNIEEYFFIKEISGNLVIRFDYNIYMMNDYSSAVYDELDVKKTVSIELNAKEIQQMNCEDSEMIVYGYIPMMISAGCGLKTLNRCDKNNQRYQLKDRKGNLFTVQCVCDYCYNLMLNCKALSLFKFSGEIKTFSLSSLRLLFTIESENEVKEVLQKAKDAFIKNRTIHEDEKTTRGHYTRGVL